MAPYKLYEYKGTPAEDERREKLVKLKLQYEKWAEEIAVELRKLIYKSETGRV